MAGGSSIGITKKFLTIKRLLLILFLLRMHQCQVTIAQILNCKEFVYCLKVKRQYSALLLRFYKCETG